MTNLIEVVIYFTTSLETSPDPDLSVRMVSSEIKVTVKVGFSVAPTH